MENMNSLDVVEMGRYGNKNLFRSLNKHDKNVAVEALKKVKMLEFAKRHISELSGGQQQRVFIARALAHGAVVTWKNVDEDNKTALHACTQLSVAKDEDSKAIECAELLIQNGAKMDARDNSEQGVLDSAVLANVDRSMIEYICFLFNAHTQ